MKGAEKGGTLVLFSVVELLEVQASDKVWHMVMLRICTDRMMA